MRRFLALVSLTLLPVLLPADEKKEDKKPAPNTLTKEEIQKGWLLLFDGETTFGWVVEGEPARVEKGVLIFGGKKPTKVSCSTWFSHYEWDVVFDAVGNGAVRPIIAEQEGFSYKESTRIRFHSNGKPHESSAHSPVKFEIPANTQARVRYARLKPVNPQPLFNGKNLDGWNVFKGDAKRQKSKFTVTKEGWLNVKDGPGDLQTEKKYDDFVLQLECISNGKYLNSGIFFRALPGEYQQGYEAQIRNEFKDKPQKYVVEEYDAKTNKLTGRKEVMSPAFDYGTGAIYRRVPARKQVSKDGEWFTMTVVARGRHFATWVNGVQQVDWTDNRPAEKNARKGYYDEAGCISIQGHDPTTDLSFRNLRIAPLPRPKKKD